MNLVAKIISAVALTLVIVPCILYFTGATTLVMVKWGALIGTVGWFIATPTWMGRELPLDASEVEI